MRLYRWRKGLARRLELAACILFDTRALDRLRRAESDALAEVEDTREAADQLAAVLKGLTARISSQPRGYISRYGTHAGREPDELWRIALCLERARTASEFRLMLTEAIPMSAERAHPAAADAFERDDTDNPYPY